MAVTLIALGASIATAISGATNTTFQLSSGIYRQPMFTLPATCSMQGWLDGLSVVSGAWLLNGTWTNSSGTLWKTTTGSYDNSGGQISLGAMTFDTPGNNAGVNTTGYPLCVWCNELYVNNVLFTFIGQGTTGAPLSPAASQWWFNTTDNSVNVNASGLGTFPGTNLLEYSNFGNASWGGSGAANYVSLTGFTVEKYCSTFQGGAIAYNGYGLFCQSMIFQWCHACGINFSTYDTTPPSGGPSIVFRNTKFLNCGQEGFSSGNSRGIEMTDCEIAGNNRAGYSLDLDAGGFKFFYCHDGTFSRNYVHNNFGNGAWWDAGNSGWIVSYNTIANNASLPNENDQAPNGLMFEAGGKRNRIYGNIVYGHKGAGIYNSSTEGTDIFQNIVTAGTSNTGTQRNGTITCANDARNLTGYTTAGGITFGTVNINMAYVNVHDNIMIHTTDTAADGIYSSTSVTNPSWTFNNNTYIVPNLTTAFWRFDPNGAVGSSAVTFAALQAGGIYEQTGQAIVATPFATQAALQAVFRDGQTPGSINPATWRNAFATVLMGQSYTTPND